MQRFTTRTLILPLGLCLCAFGLALESRGQSTGGTGTQNPVPETLPNIPAYGTADSNGQMIAVTGVDISGASILYVIDTRSRNLSVYQALSGGSSTAGVRWLGARNIDLDLKVNGYSDKSQFTFSELEQKFAENAGEPPETR